MRGRRLHYQFYTSLLLSYCLFVLYKFLYPDTVLTVLLFFCSRPARVYLSPLCSGVKPLPPRLQLVHEMPPMPWHTMHLKRSITFPFTLLCGWERGKEVGEWELVFGGGE